MRCQGSTLPQEAVVQIGMLLVFRHDSRQYTVLAFGRPHERKVDWEWLQKDAVLVSFHWVSGYLPTSTADSGPRTKFEV